MPKRKVKLSGIEKELIEERRRHKAIRMAHELEQLKKQRGKLIKELRPSKKRKIIRGILKRSRQEIKDATPLAKKLWYATYGTKTRSRRKKRR